MKLYPPQIEGIIPSFTIEPGQGTVITVPFSMNQAVSQIEISNFSLKVKNIISNEYILTVTASSFNFNTNEVYFTLLPTQSAVFNVGEHYKVQLAYIDINDDIGYYSTVGVIKCTDKVQSTIENLIENQSNMHKYSYKGKFYHADSTEKAYQYQFIITDKEGNIFHDTGWKSHFVEKDEDMYISYDLLQFYKDLQINERYYIQYNVITNNQLKVVSKKYCIIQAESVDMEEPIYLQPTLNFDNGYIQISIESDKSNPVTKEFFAQGNFLISRSSLDTNYMEWEPLRIIKINGKGPLYSKQKDFTIEQGKKYKYAIQKFNTHDILTNRKETEEIYADFEDAFLSDGQYQLKIRYNPQVNNFKTVLQENKVETIGSKFPFIFKNGSIEYKEFPIGGLISYQMDESDTFVIDKNELGFDYEYTLLDRHSNNSVDRLRKLEDRRIELYNLLYKDETKRRSYSKQELEAFSVELKNIYTIISRVNDGINRYDKEVINSNEHAMFDQLGNNFMAERVFKIKVLNWLNNGRPKMFRSPGEGNYIVRLLNTSLAPENPLGRMLHTFSTTAVEIADFNYDNLKKYHFINVDEINFTFLLWHTILLAEPVYNHMTTQDSNWEYYEDVLDEDVQILYNTDHTVRYLTGEILPKGRVAQSVYFYDLIPGTTVQINGTDIVIGATGSYYAESQNGITSVYIPDNKYNYYTGSVTYNYYGDSKTDFDLIVNETVKEQACRQFIGEHENILNDIEDIKTSVINFYNLDFCKRDIVDVEYVESRVLYYFDKNCTKQIFLTDDYNFNNQLIDTDYYAKVSPIDEEKDNIDTGIERYILYQDKDESDVVRNYDNSIDLYYYDELTQEYIKMDFLDRLPPVYYMKNFISFNLKDQKNTTVTDLDNKLVLYKYDTDNLIINGQVYKFKNYIINYEPYIFHYHINENDEMYDELYGDYQEDVFDNKDFYVYNDETDSYQNITGDIDFNQQYYIQKPLQYISFYKDFNSEVPYVSSEDYELIKSKILDQMYTPNDQFDNIYSTLLNLYMRDYFNYSGDKLYVYDRTAETMPIISKGKLYNITKDELIQFYLIKPLLYKVNINDEDIDLTNEQHYEIQGISNYNKIGITNGLYLNCSYKSKVITYSLEEDSDDLIFTNYKEKLAECIAQIDHTDTDSYINIDDLTDVLSWYKKELITLLSNTENADAENVISNSTQDYNALIDEYLIYLNLYEQCQLGEIAITDIDISQYPRLSNKFNEILNNYDVARNNYYNIYNNYIKRLDYLMKKYKEENADVNQ